MVVLQSQLQFFSLLLFYFCRGVVYHRQQTEKRICRDAMSWKNLAALTLAVSLLGGCSVVERLVYRIDINQGNYLEQSDVDTLRYGMNKEQVQFVLGSPMISEPEYPNTWYYVYYHKPGHDKPEQKNLILTFNDQNRLVKMEGDYTPSPQFMDGMN